jgi:hypothetical protein
LSSLSHVAPTLLVWRRRPLSMGPAIINPGALSGTEFLQE